MTNHVPIDPEELDVLTTNHVQRDLAASVVITLNHLKPPLALMVWVVVLPDDLRTRGHLPSKTAVLRLLPIWNDGVVKMNPLLVLHEKPHPALHLR